MTVARLRIVAGELRGRRLDVPPGDRVRPTSDRVREALFAILGERVRGVRVLDLFAGTGALGLEALSRGADRVTFVEDDREVAAVLRANVDRVGMGSRVDVVLGDAVRTLRKGAVPGAPFGVVLADPPYGGSLAADVLEALAVAPLVLPGAVVVVESEARDEPPAPAGAAIRHDRRARYGRTALDFFHFLGSPGSR